MGRARMGLAIPHHGEQVPGRSFLKATKLIKHFFIQEVFMLDFTGGLPIMTLVLPARRSSIRGK